MRYHNSSSTFKQGRKFADYLFCHTIPIEEKENVKINNTEDCLYFHKCKFPKKKCNKNCEKYVCGNGININKMSKTQVQKILLQEV